MKALGAFIYERNGRKATLIVAVLNASTSYSKAKNNDVLILALHFAFKQSSNDEAALGSFIFTKIVSFFGAYNVVPIPFRVHLRAILCVKKIRLNRSPLIPSLQSFPIHPMPNISTNVRQSDPVFFVLQLLMNELVVFFVVENRQLSIYRGAAFHRFLPSFWDSEMFVESAVWSFDGCCREESK